MTKIYEKTHIIQIQKVKLNYNQYRINTSLYVILKTILCQFMFPSFLLIELPEQAWHFERR